MTETDIQNSDVLSLRPPGMSLYHFIVIKKYTIDATIMNAIKNGLQLPMKPKIRIDIKRSKFITL